MDYREKARLNQDKSIRIKHMAFAVEDINKTKVYNNFLSIFISFLYIF